MGRVGSCFDNAAAESWFSTLEWELFRKRDFATKLAARREVAWFIDWYNRTRRHSSCEMKSLVEFEQSLLLELSTRSTSPRQHEDQSPQSPQRPATRPGGIRHRGMKDSISYTEPSTNGGKPRTEQDLRIASSRCGLTTPSRLRTDGDTTASIDSGPDINHQVPNFLGNRDEQRGSLLASADMSHSVSVDGRAPSSSTADHPLRTPAPRRFR